MVCCVIQVSQYSWKAVPVGPAMSSARRVLSSAEFATDRTRLSETGDALDATVVDVEVWAAGAFQGRAFCEVLCN